MFKDVKRQSKIKIITMHLCILTSLLLFSMPVFALGFDTSIDEQIRKNYNPSKLEEDMTLPAMPKVLQEEKNNVSTSKTTEAGQQNQNTLQPINNSLNSKNVYAVLKKGTKIKLKLMNNVSDKTKKGTKLTFVSLYPVTTTYFTIPLGTTFKGEVVNSHPPQFSANGGLIVIKIDSVILNNGTVF